MTNLTPPSRLRGAGSLRGQTERMVRELQAALGEFLPLTGGTVEGPIVLETSSGDQGGIVYAYDSTGRRILMLSAEDAPGDLDEPRIQIHHSSDSFGAEISFYMPSGQALEVGGLQVRFADGSESEPAITFIGDTNTGIFRGTADTLDIAAGGKQVARFQLLSGSPILIVDDIGDSNLLSPRMQAVGSNSLPAYSFRGDTDTGMYRYTTDGIAFAGGSTAQLYFSPSEGRYPAINHTTTAAAANVFINATTHLLARSTSSLKYKPGWQFADEAELAKLELPNPIVWIEHNIRDNELTGEVEEDQDIFLGFGTEHVYEMLPTATQDFDEDGHPQNYDVRSLVAVLAAKVKRLEKSCLK